MRTETQQIPEGNYTGYYWLSNAEKPEEVRGNFDQKLIEQRLPFIVEGNLYDASKKRSISIRHNGERHVIYQYELNDLTGFKENKIKFIVHRLPGKARVKFCELWKEETDMLCAGMKTLKPFARVFVGFEENKEADH